MKGTTRAAAAVFVACGLAIGMAGPSLANTSDANLRQDDMRGLQMVDDDDLDPRGNNCRWVPDNTNDNTRDATTDGVNTRPGFTLTCTDGVDTRSTNTRDWTTDNTRDLTRSVDFTRDLTLTNTRGR